MKSQCLVDGRSAARRRGQVIVEFALSLLLVLVVVFGIVEIGRLMLTYSALANAARTGVRYAVVHGGQRRCGTGGCDADGPSGPSANPPNVIAVVQGILTAANLPIATGSSCPAGAGSLDIQVSYPDGQNTVGDRIQVTACYGYVPILPVIPFISPIHLSSTTQGTVSY